MAFLSQRRRALVAALAVGATLAACDLSSTKEPTDAGVHGERPPPVSATLDMDARGGVVAILEAPSPLLGASFRVPPDALAGTESFELSAAEALPQGSNALGVGEALVVAPDVELRAAATGEIPVPAGVPLTGLTAARWDEEAGSWSLLPGADTRPDDPRTGQGGVVVFETNRTGTFRIVYQDPQPVDVLNDGSSPIDVTLATPRFTTAEGRGYVPPPPRRAELEQTLEPTDVRELLLVPGEYVLRGTFEDETEARCVALSVSDPVTSLALSVSFSDFTPPCPLPAVRVTATPREAGSNEEVTLEAVATGETGATFSWHWTVTGGEISGVVTGTVMSGAPVEATWMTPEAPGTYWATFSAYVDEELFGSGRTSIEVTTRNQRPAISGLTASPAVVGPGFPAGARATAETSFPGVARVRAVTSDLDGDAVDLFWIREQPGDFFDATSGAKLTVDEETSLVAWPETGEPYTAEEILYMAPPSDVVDSLSRGMWFPFGVIASDGELSDRSWTMVSVVAGDPALPDAGATPDGGGLDGGPPRDAGGTRDAGADAGPDVPAVTGRCLSVIDAECEMYVGSFYRSEADSLMSACEAAGRTWTADFACPESGALGACYRFPGEEREVATVYYDPSPTPGEIEMRRTDCRNLPVAEGGPGTWQNPYRAPR